MATLILCFFQLYEKKGDAGPGSSVLLGIGALLFLIIGVYYAVTITLKRRAANDEIWEKATTAIGLVRDKNWSSGVQSMTGTIDGRDVVLSSMIVELKYSFTHRIYRYNLCRLTFSSPLGTSFGVIPKTAYLWQNLGGNIQMQNATFNEYFKIWADDVDFLTRLLTTPLEGVDGPPLVDELADMSERHHKWIHFTESVLEFGYRYKNRYDLQLNDDLEAQLRRNFTEAVEFATRIENRAKQLRQSKDEPVLRPDFG